MAGREVGAELAQHRGVESWVGEVEAQEVVPVDAATSRLGYAATRTALGEPPSGDESEPPGRFSRGQDRSTTL